MITISQTIEHIVISTPFLSDALTNGLINYSGFARLYRKEIEKKTMKTVTVGAIVMALKRLNKKQKKRTGLESIFSGAPEIIVRSQLSELTVENRPDLIQIQRKILDYSTETPSTLVAITHGVFETTIIGNQQLMSRITKLYEKSAIISTVDTLSAVTIKFSKDIVEVPGVVYTILNLVTWKGINLVEVVSTYSELTLIIEQKDVDLVFSLIQQVFQN